MKLPPITDPMRPVVLAAWWMYGFGGVTTLLGLAVVLYALWIEPQLSGVSGAAMMIVAVLLTALLLFPGIMYLICGVFLSRRQIAAGYVAEGGSFLYLFALAALAVMTLPQLPRSWTGLLIVLLWALPVIVIARKTAVAITTLRRHKPAIGAGFEPVLPQDFRSVQPIDSSRLK